MTAEIVVRRTHLRLLAEPTCSRSNFMDGFRRMPIAFARVAGVVQ